MTTPKRDRRDDNWGHDKSPISLRLPDDLQTWAEAYAEATDQTRHAVLIAAIREYKERHTSR